MDWEIPRDGLGQSQHGELIGSYEMAWQHSWCHGPFSARRPWICIRKWSYAVCFSSASSVKCLLSQALKSVRLFSSRPDKNVSFPEVLASATVVLWPLPSIARCNGLMVSLASETLGKGLWVYPEAFFLIMRVLVIACGRLASVKMKERSSQKEYIGTWVSMATKARNQHPE